MKEAPTKKQIKARTSTERARIKAYQEKVAAKLEKKVMAKFQNLETPKANVEFTYEGHTYNFDDGKEYEMPVTIMNHLNRLTVTEKELIVDPLTGQGKHQTKSTRNRFAVYPVATEDAV